MRSHEPKFQFLSWQISGAWKDYYISRGMGFKRGKGRRPPLPVFVSEHILQNKQKRLGVIQLAGKQLPTNPNNRQGNTGLTQ